MENSHYSKLKYLSPLTLLMCLGLLPLSLYELLTGADKLQWLFVCIVAFLGQALILVRYSKGRRFKATETARMSIIRTSLQRVTEFSQTQAPHTLYNEIVKNALAETAKNLRVERVGLWVLDKDRTELESVFCYSATRCEFDSGTRLNAVDFPKYFASLEEAQIIDAHDTLKDERTSELSNCYLKPLRITSMLDARVQMTNESSGIICIEHTGKRRVWTTVEQTYALSVANLMSVAGGALYARAMADLLLMEKDKAQASNKVKTSFLTNMSHEFRTPLNGVLGMASILRAEPGISQYQVDGLDVIMNSGQSLLGILSDVLDISKIEADDLVLEDKPFDLQYSIDEASHAWRKSAVEKGLTLRIETGQIAQTCLRGDPARVRQILHNLVDNAIKFTSEGEVSIEVEQSAISDIRTQTTLRVIDTGIGISAEQIDALFVNFGQVDSSHTREFGGTGLGLSISKRLANRFGGDIIVQSEPGKGSVFECKIILDNADSLDDENLNDKQFKSI